MSSKVHEIGTSEIDAAKSEAARLEAARLDDSLMAVTPIDGRYHSRTRTLGAYFSEFALIRYRVRVEIEWLIALAENPAIKEFSLDG